MTLEVAVGLWLAVTLLAIVSAVYLAAVLIPPGSLRSPRRFDRHGRTARR